jgi:hypothetical protein
MMRRSAHVGSVSGISEDLLKLRASGSGLRAGQGPKPEAPSLKPPQFVKRRIRTLRIRPNPASVAIMEEPP